MEQLVNYINHFVTLDEETQSAIQQRFKREVFSKDEFLLEEGSICNKIYFIESGLIRRFVVRGDEEITQWLYHDGHWLTSLASYFQQKPTYEYLQACERTAVYSLSSEKEQELLSYPLFLAFHVQLMRNSLAGFDEFHFKMDSMNAREKYEYLLTNFPLILQKAKLKQVASMIHVSPETLSRIRSGIN